MPKLNVDESCRLIHRGRECRYDGRHEDITYWTADRTNEKFSFTDEELARALAGQDSPEGGAPRIGVLGDDPLIPPTRLIRSRLSECTALSPVEFVPPESRSDSDLADGEYRLKYVLGCRERGCHLSLDVASIVSVR